MENEVETGAIGWFIGIGVSQNTGVPITSTVVCGDLCSGHPIYGNDPKP